MPIRLPATCLAALLSLCALGCGGGTNSPPGQGEKAQTLDAETGSASLSAPPPEAAKP